MLSFSTASSDHPTTWVLVHGACTYPNIFDFWHDDVRALGAAEILTPDLQAGSDPATLTTAGQAAQVTAALNEAQHPVVIVAWSMGGLVSMTVADHPAVVGLILLEPSMPAPLLDPERKIIEPRPGLLDHDATYGPVSDGYPRRPESSPARDERKNGVDVPPLPPATRVMVVWGPQFPDRGRPVAELLGAEQLELPHSSHMDMVIDDATRTAILTAWQRAGNVSGAPHVE
ncbi:MAG: alpha/beta hydrolase [Propionibacteriaceae bacterium]|nr:alpha/beta hydrolase [Propionibacteriaceae bacterium]